MNTKQKTGVALMAVVFGLILSPAIVSNEAEAKGIQPTMILQGDLTAPNGDGSFGKDVVGSYYSHVSGDKTTIYVKISTRASSDIVYEGWLVDVDSGKKTSLGKFQAYRDGQLLTSLENQFNNDLIVITEEPRVDSDPAPNTAIGGAVLGTPFGQ